jgi:hypothetical protein
VTFNESLSRSATMRASTSGVEPGAADTRKRIGFDGQESCAYVRPVVIVAVSHAMARQNSLRFK